MMIVRAAHAWWWLVHKDLLRELRAPRVWPTMLLLAVVIVLVIELLVHVPIDQHRSLLAGLFWIAALFAGTISLDRSIAGEQEQGCWQGLLLYPVASGGVFLAKLTANALALGILDTVLLLALHLLSGVWLLEHPFRFAVTALLANLGLAAAGTLTSALAGGLAHRSGLLVLLLLPLVLPVMLAAVQSTRALLADDAAQWWRWAQLLACFAAVFITLGTLTFEFLAED